MNRQALLVGHFTAGFPGSDPATSLEAGIPGLAVTQVGGGLEILTHLAQEPERYAVVILDLAAAGLPADALLQGIREVNPKLEIILLTEGEDQLLTGALAPGPRPLLLRSPVSPEVLVSAVSKLLELVASREEHARVQDGFRRHLSLARKNVEAILALMNRPVGVGIISTRRDGFITFYNPVARQLTGYSQDELPHIRKWAETLLRDPGSMMTVLTSLTRFWSQGAAREEMPLRIRHKDGRILTLSATTLVLQDDRGEPRQLVILIFDPKDRAEAKACKTLLEQSDLGFYVYHRQSGFQSITPNALALMNKAFDLDLHTEDIRGRQIHELPLPDGTASRWQGWVERQGDSPGNRPSLPPLGLPGRRIVEHSLVAPYQLQEDGPGGVVALVRAREDLLAETHAGLGHSELCELTLQEIPYAFLLLRAERAGGGEVTDFRCLALNRAARRLLGRGETEPAEALLLSQLVANPGSRERLFGRLVAITETGGQESFEFTLPLRVEEAHLHLVYFWLGKVGDGAAVFFRDVTEKREEEKALKQYQHIFAHMEESIVVTDLEGNIIDWNPASERMYGYRKEEILGSPAFLLTSDRAGEPLHQEAREILRDGDVWKGEYRFTRRDGQPGVASTVFAVLRDDRGRPYGTVGLSHDVTESKKMEERLKIRTRELQEKNLALNTLLRHAEEERLRACQQVAAEVTSKFTEGLQQIVGSKHSPETVDHLSRAMLQDLGQENTKPEFRGPGDPLAALSSKEMEVARLIRLGKTTDEIAFLLEKSTDTVRLQRISIRKKLGLSRRDHNLQEALKQLDIF
ncbi:MAG: PAS domain S-box protein [Deltaproteobacteria bacterium]|nr:PAS domain S-box protein [Deltaproteobacteria bacterium]